LELRRSVYRLLQDERIHARLYAAGPPKGEILCVLRDDSIDRGLAAATPQLIGRERTAGALRTWPQPHPRLPATVASIADIVLVGYLAIQAACTETELPVPGIGELDARQCQREAGQWRLDLSRPDATCYLHNRRPGTPELVLAATAWVSEQATASVVIVSQHDVTEASRAHLEAALAEAQRYRRAPEGDH